MPSAKFDQEALRGPEQTDARSFRQWNRWCQNCNRRPTWMCGVALWEKLSAGDLLVRHCACPPPQSLVHRPCSWILLIVVIDIWSCSQLEMGNSACGHVLGSTSADHSLAARCRNDFAGRRRRLAEFVTVNSAGGGGSIRMN
jgi:hypothetical protein